MRRQLLIVASALLATVVLSGSRSMPDTAHGSPQATPTLAPPVVVLRMETVGGFAPLQALLLRVPTFTLYADGTAIYRPAPDTHEDPSSAPLAMTILSPEQRAELLELALDDGGLRGAREDYQVGGVADATTTVFTVRVGEVDKTVSVYALGLDVRGPDRAAYRRFLRLAELLADFGAWLPADAEVSVFEPSAYRGVFVDDDPELPDALPWPWTDLAPTDLLPLPDAPAILQADLTPAQVAVVSDVPTGGASGLTLKAPDGSAAWQLSIRPLLPDEPPLLDVAPGASDAGPDETAPSDGQAYVLSG